MKKFSLTLGLTLSVTLIVLSLLVPVNYSVSAFTQSGLVLVADGSGLPPVPPPPPPPQKIGKGAIINGLLGTVQS